MKNARYVGGSGTGVDLTVQLVDGQRRPVHLDPGDALPRQIAGVDVAPELVEQLLEQESEWDLVAAATSTTTTTPSGAPARKKKEGGTS